LERNQIDELCAIEAASFTTPWTRPLFEEELKKPGLCYWRVLLDPAAAPGARVRAYGGFWRAVDEAHFTNIAVHPDARRQGLGRRLLRELLTLAKAEGCHSATLEVRPSNAPARALYEAEGFEAAAIRPRYYSDDGEDALILWRHQL
jgi:ribosomal-protein-alanine N-acetyltransferase